MADLEALLGLSRGEGADLLLLEGESLGLAVGGDSVPVIPAVPGGCSGGRFERSKVVSLQ